MTLKSLPNCRRSVCKDVRLFLYAPHNTQYYSVIQSTEKYYSRTILYFFSAKLPLTNEVYIYIYFFFMLHPYSWIQTYICMSVCYWIEVMLWWVFVQICIYINIIRKLQSFFPLHSPCRSTSSSSLLCNDKQYSKLHFSHSAHRASKQVFDLLLLVVNGFTRISFCSSHRQADDLRDSSAPIFSVAKCCQSFLFAPPLLREGFATGTTSPASDTSSTLPSSKGGGSLLPPSGPSTTSGATSKALSLR